MAEVERVAPNEAIDGVTFGMEALAELAEAGGAGSAAALAGLPALYGAWIADAAWPDRRPGTPGARETASG